MPMSHATLSFYWNTNGKFSQLSSLEISFKIIACRDFFCLENDPSLLYSITVPPEEFVKLVEVAEKLGITDDPKLIATIKKNIPADYDLNNFSSDFFKEYITNKLLYCIKHR